MSSEFLLFILSIESCRKKSKHAIVVVSSVNLLATRLVLAVPAHLCIGHNRATMTESNHHNGAPRTRQRAYKAPPRLDVPDIEDDASERKRVLNVLAQRRYRKDCGLQYLTLTNIEYRREKETAPAEKAVTR